MRGKSANQPIAHSLSVTRTHHQALDGVVFDDKFALFRTGVGQLHECLDRPFLHVGVGRRDQSGQVLRAPLLRDDVADRSYGVVREVSVGDGEGVEGGRVRNGEGG